MSGRDTREQVGTVRCLARGCPWRYEGTPAAAGTEAKRHGGELVGGPPGGHPTLLSTVAVDAPGQAPGGG